MKKISELEKCPHCGHDEFYTKQRVSGTMRYSQRYDGGESENGDCYDALNYKQLGNYAYCVLCDKKVGILKGKDE